jgi:hypothetical protein
MDLYLLKLFMVWDTVWKFKIDPTVYLLFKLVTSDKPIGRFIIIIFRFRTLY